MIASLVFLTPLAALVELAMLIPLGAFVVAERRVATVRRVLVLRPPRAGVDVVAVASLVATVALLALAAAQPALSNEQAQRIRTDAAALFVVDISESMAASSGPTGRTRLQRAIAAASTLRASIPDVPSGVATLTDRLLPNLLPVADPAAFDATLRRTLAIDEPPPKEQSLRATSFSALAGIPGAGYFDPAAKHRAIVLLTDGESSPFDASSIARALGDTKLATVQLWRRNEAIYAQSGKQDPNYRPDPRSTMQLEELASAAHGRAFAEGEIAAAGAALRDAFGRGPTRSEGRARSTHPLAPYLVLLALVPLALSLGRGARGRFRGPAAEQVTFR